MAAANTQMDAQKASRNTPGRRGRTGAQYFDVGKVGRKTGITLKDTGVRDEHGMEPMSGIFSSPASPPKRAQGTSSSNAMERRAEVGLAAHAQNIRLQESSAPDVDETLQMRKTPRLPPPRASTPRHTNIGSPKRMSSARPQSRNADVPMASDATPDRASSHPPANRLLNFGREKVRMSVENGSPFKPKRVLRRSIAGAQTDEPEENNRSGRRDAGSEIVEEDEPAYEGAAEAEAGAEDETEKPNDDRDEREQRQLDDQLADDAPPMFDNDDYGYDEQHDSDDPEITEAFQHAEELLQTTPSVKPASKGGRGRPRKSGASGDASVIDQTQLPSSGRKRDRTEIENDEVEQTHQSIEQTDIEASQISNASAKRPRGRPRKSQVTIVQDQDDQTVDQGETTVQSIEHGDQDVSQVSAASEQPARKGPGRPRKSDITVHQDQTEQTIDPALLAHGDSYLAPVDEEGDATPAPAPPVTKKKPGRKPKPQKAPKAPKERDPNKSMRRTPSASPGKSEKRDQLLSPSKRAGSVSNVNLRASTPFEDAHQRMSRSGRPILKPLKHWAGESYVWKNGEVEGIIRADEVKTPKGGKKKKPKGRRRAPRAGGRGASNDLDSIAEESDTESTVPDEWEEQVGVIAGTVAAWDPDSQQGNPENPIREDIAFASSSILTRDVAGSAFQYAKIMTLPFFGSGIVELPPEGFKRAKNSRKMQMVFFVHDGKVLVTVGPPSVEQNGRGGSGDDTETNEFAISKGGVWVVPRGNNYSITNESRTKNARIFFAQGCEVEPEM